jgi:hypothetical protein
VLVGYIAVLKEVDIAMEGSERGKCSIYVNIVRRRGNILTTLRAMAVSGSETDLVQ